MKLNDMKKVVLLGASGHARVVLDCLLLRKSEYNVQFITDQDASLHGKFIYGIEVKGGDSILDGLGNEFSLIIGIGNNTIRRSLFKYYCEEGFDFINAIHPSSVVSEHAFLGTGIVAMACSTVNCDAQIGDNVIINTAAKIDHECRVGNHSHISPGVSIAGNVKIGEECHIGIGASIIENIVVGDRSVVGAGSVVIRNVPPDTVVAGVPAKELIAKRV